jgi:hypothetical protein
MTGLNKIVFRNIKLNFLHNLHVPFLFCESYFMVLKLVLKQKAQKV